MPLAQEFEAGVAADVPGAARDEDPHEFTPLTNWTTDGLFAWLTPQTDANDIVRMRLPEFPVNKNMRAG